MTAIPLHEGQALYGHGAVPADGTLLYSTETRAIDGSGVITVRNVATLEYVGEFPSHGDHPHDCRLIDGGRVMVVRRIMARATPTCWANYLVMSAAEIGALKDKGIVD